MSDREIIMQIVGDVAGLRTDIQHILKALEEVRSTCRRRCDHERNERPDVPITAKLMVAVGAVASAASAVVVALISAIPPTISAIAGWFNQKP